MPTFVGQSGTARSGLATAKHPKVGRLFKECVYRPRWILAIQAAYQRPLRRDLRMDNPKRQATGIGGGYI